MSKDQGKFGLNNQESFGQGSFGELHGLDNSWICPNCETINTEDICFLCGYQKKADDGIGDDFGKWKKLIVIFAVLACVIAGGILTWILTDRESENIGTYGAMHEETADVQVEATTVPIEETTAVPEETVSIAAEDMRNVLMEDPCKDLESDMYNKAFGGNIIRARIGTITFLDTLEEAPDTSWDVSAAKDGSVLAWTELTRDTGFGDYDLYIGAEGGVIASENCSYLFARYIYLQNIDFNNAFDTENVSTMKGMFSGCGEITSLDLSGFDTSSVTNMSGMFANCSQLTALHISGFDTSKVTDMGSMFDGCWRIRQLDVSAFDTSKVTDMSQMFLNCNYVSKLDVSGFDTSNVSNMASMFHFCVNLVELDVSGFDTSKVTDMSAMFNGCWKIAQLDVNGFDTSNVTDMGWMFDSCKTLTELDLSGFDTSSVTDMWGMFQDAVNLRKLDISGFDTSNVTNMKEMFKGCKNLRNLAVGEFNTSKVETFDNFMDDGKKFNGRPWQELFA